MEDNKIMEQTEEVMANADEVMEKVEEAMDLDITKVAFIAGGIALVGTAGIVIYIKREDIKKWLHNRKEHRKAEKAEKAVAKGLLK